MFGSKTKLTSSELIAEKVLADGTRIPLGTLSYWHRNPVKRLFFKLFGVKL